MTSGIGKTLRLEHGGPFSDRRGFTMVEVLMVVAIIMMLTAMMTVAVMSQRKRAAKQATQALFVRLEAAIESYKELAGHYPPDGFDFEVTNDEGTAIRGSACLHYFLTKQLTVERKVSGLSRITKHDPVVELKEGELTLANEDFPGAREITDGHKVPLHYDNTENDEFEAQDETAHLEELTYHPEDARLNSDQLAVEEGGIQNPGKYDLWSHGDAGHTETETLETTVGNWNAPGLEDSE